jgi:site-specific DNA-methyltransferase (adenine-specific)
VVTRTQPFGTGKRESHDGCDFYARFAAPERSADATVQPCPAADQLFCGDARAMTAVDDRCVALVVTSPPSYAGKEYEQALGEGHVTASYLEFLVMLRDVFAECRRVPEPGGRLAVNVANLGRRPYRSLSADVIRILEDDLGLLLRGEIVWRKAKGATGSIAVGSYRSASNPVLRDVTERVVVASKGRSTGRRRRRSGSDPACRSRTPSPRRRSSSRPSTCGRSDPSTPAGSATRRRSPSSSRSGSSTLYTYRGDVVLDPFLGSGSTAVAAVRAGRRYVGYDTDPGSVALAEARVASAGPGPAPWRRPHVGATLPGGNTRR